MKAITFQAVEEVVVEDVPEPTIVEPTDVVVRTEVSGLCGSDLHPYFGREVGLDRGTIMGHEFVGTVEAVGGAVDSWSVGDRVVAPFTTNCGSCYYCSRGLTARCPEGQLFGWVEGGEGLHGAQAELVRVPMAASTLVKVPGSLAPEIALLGGDILSTAVFGTASAGVASGDVVAVVGCGPVGLLSIRAALARGAEAVFAVDFVSSRLEAAARFGATPLDGTEKPVEAVRARTEGRGADAVIEAAGPPSATRLAADLARAGGRIAALAVHTEAALGIPPGEIYDKNLTYSSGRCPARHYLPQALDLATQEAELLEGLITHQLPLSDGPDAYRAFGAREAGWDKVVFRADLPAT